VPLNAVVALTGLLMLLLAMAEVFARYRLVPLEGKAH
jgi:hypothetical protein